MFQLAGVAGAVFIRLLGSTVGTIVPNRFVLDELKSRYGRVIFALYHGQLLLGTYLARGRHVATIISRHRDGEFIYQIASRLGVEAVRGSSTRGGSRALYQLLVSPEFAERDLAITPDGPLGPAGSVKRGIVVIAKILGVPILPVAIVSSSAWRFDSWDRFQVPRPFSRAYVLLGEPIAVGSDIGEAEVEKSRSFLEEKLSDLNSNASERLAILEEESRRRRNDDGPGGRISRLVSRYLDRERESAWTLPLTLSLLPFEMIYRLLVGAKNWSYQNHVFRSKRLPVPVISVGNLSVGGTGKTSLVKWLGRRLARDGHRVAILTRGYGAAGSDGIRVVPNSMETLRDSRTLGDEPVYLARELPGSTVIRGRDRYLAGLVAVARFGCDVCVLDDGFQFRRLHRDIDIVMVNRDRPFRGRLLPSGRLREGRKALRRADLVVESNRWGGGDKGGGAASGRRYGEIPRVRASLVIDRIYLLRDPTWGMGTSLDIGGKRVLAFAGIGDPRSFQYLVEGCFPAVVYYVFFRDHHLYPRLSVERLHRAFDRIGADILLTTEKDAVKLQADDFIDRPCWVLSTRLVIEEGQENLDELLALCRLGREKRRGTNASRR